MAVEQRIGRIHRYGQQETVQVYNLFAEDTVEERIYDLLEDKLGEIARAIGKTDERGQPREDFRGEILGLLGSRPDYQDLFKRALVDPDYRRTEADIVQMLREADRARQALDSLTQDLTRFNLEHYRHIEGRHTLAELGQWVREMLVRCGGSVVPNGDFWTLHVPEFLQRKYQLAPRFEKVCFERALALRSRGSELGGIGHPVVDALLSEAQEPAFAGSVTTLDDGNVILARYLVQYDGDDGRKVGRVITLRTASDGTVELLEKLPRVEIPVQRTKDTVAGNEYTSPKELIEGKRNEVIMQWLPDRSRRARVTSTLIGLSRGLPVQ
jgi:hypothetical protein